MPNIKSQKKRVITSAKAQLANKAVKSNLKTEIKKADAAVASAVAEDKQKAVSSVFATIDKAAKKNVIHKNNANRKKAAIAKKANAGN